MVAVPPGDPLTVNVPVFAPAVAGANITSTSQVLPLGRAGRRVGESDALAGVAHHNEIRPGDGRGQNARVGSASRVSDNERRSSRKIMHLAPAVTEANACVVPDGLVTERSF